MVTEYLRAGNPIDQFIGNFGRFNGADANSLHQIGAFDGSQQIGQAGFGPQIQAIAAKMNAGQNDFMNSVCFQSANGLQHGFQRQALASAPCKGHNAVGAEGITAILDF